MEFFYCRIVNLISEKLINAPGVLVNEDKTEN